MAIVAPGPIDPHSPFADWLDLTYPLESAPDVEAVILPRLAEAFAVRESATCYRIPAFRRFAPGADAVGVWVEPRRKLPTIHVERLRSVGRFSISGQACEALRALDVWAPLLADVSQHPHRVTRLDPSLDLPIPGPDVLPLVRAAAESGELLLGRKRVRSLEVKNRDELDRRGCRTGSVRLRSRSAEISLLVYDKRHEREEAGLPDCGPLTRFELTVKAVGCTLRDACMPAGVFWNYAHTVVERPQGAPDWSGAGEGFDLPPAPPPDYWRILQRRVDDWVELRQLCEVADKLGAYGRRMLLGLIARAIGVDLPEPSGVSS